MLRQVKDNKDYQLLWKELKEATERSLLKDPSLISISLDELRAVMLRMEKEQEETFVCHNCERYSLQSPDGFRFDHLCQDKVFYENCNSEIDFVPAECPGWIERKNKPIVVEMIE